METGNSLSISNVSCFPFAEVGFVELKVYGSPIPRDFWKLNTGLHVRGAFLKISFIKNESYERDSILNSCRNETSNYIPAASALEDCYSLGRGGTGRSWRSSPLEEGTLFFLTCGKSTYSHINVTCTWNTAVNITILTFLKRWLYFFLSYLLTCHKKRQVFYMENKDN